jgi:hypothetical protein
MTADRIKALLDERPFRPFEIQTSDGEHVRVASPDVAWIHPAGLTMYVCPDPAFDVDMVIDLRHVTKLVNGRQRKRGK